MPKKVYKAGDPLTSAQILNHLIDVMKTPACHSGANILITDLVNQENLCNFQEEMSMFLAMLGNTVPGGPELLAKEFPRVFVAR